MSIKSALLLCLSTTMMFGRLCSVTPCLYDCFGCMLVPLFKMLYVMCFTDSSVDSSGDFVVSLLVLQLHQFTAFAYRIMRVTVSSLFLHILHDASRSCLSILNLIALVHSA